MGLDMYLEKFPLVKGKVNGVVKTLTPANFCAVADYGEYDGYLARPLRDGETEKCSFAEWSSYAADNLPDMETVEELLANVKPTYSVYDKEKTEPRYAFYEQVGYWRKENAIHSWFVKNIQNGEDDCDYHRAITKAELEDLKSICQHVLNNVNSAEQFLPSASGFFFGSTEYDEDYLDGLKDTIAIIDNVLNNTDFNNEQIYYVSSW